MIANVVLSVVLTLSPVAADTNGEWSCSCAVPRRGAAKLLVPHSVGRIDSPDWTALRPGEEIIRCNPGWGMTYRMVAVLNETGDSYAIVQKGAREHASFLRVRVGKDANEILLDSGYVPDADDLKSGKLRLPFETRVLPFRGGWFEAARLYRGIVADEPWLKAARARNFGKLRDVSFWFWNRLDSETVIRPIERFAKDAGVSVALDWYWWHKISYDTAYPNYWPPREPIDKFAAAVKRLNGEGIFCQTYMNGMLWDVDDPSWTKGGEQGVRRRRDGTFPSTAWNRFTNHRLADMCGEAPEFQRRMRSLVRKMRALGFDGQYLDCIGNGGYGPCWATNHAHAAGGGTHMVRNFRKYVGEVMRENPGMALCTEDVNEGFLDLFTSYIVTSPSYERFGGAGKVKSEQVPVFMAVYHGAGVFFGNFATLSGVPAWDPQWPAAERWTEELDWPRMFPDQFQVEVARGVVWGLQPTAHNFRMEDISNPSCAAGYRFMIDTAKFHQAHRDFLFDGEMLDPGRLDCAEKEVRFLNRGTYTKKGEYSVATHTLPTVFHSIWRNARGESAAILVNWSGTPQRYRLVSPDVVSEGELPPRSWRLVAGRNELPDVLLLGDSIRLGYCGLVREKLKGRANVYYPEDNCRYAYYTLRSLYDWQKGVVPDPKKVAVVHWNNGLWDLGQRDARPDPVTPLADYTNALVHIFHELRHYYPNARIVFATTTPINPKVHCEQHTLGNAIVEEYNAAARAALEPLGASIDDLYAFCRKNTMDKYADIVHYTKEGCALQAEQVIRSLPLDRPTTVATSAESPDVSKWFGANLLGLFNAAPQKPDPRVRGKFEEKYFRWFKDWGFTFARLPMDYRYFLQTNDWTRLKADGFAKVDEAVAWGRKYGVHVQLCLHRAPGYTVLSWVPEMRHLQTDADAQAEFMRIWREFARRYRGIPNRELSFNLINEPMGFSEVQFVRVFGRTIDAIREEDPGRFVMLDGNHCASTPVAHFYDVPLTGQAFRGYTPHAISHYLAWYIKPQPEVEPTWPFSDEMAKRKDWVYEDPSVTLAKFAAPRASGYPVMIGEFGCYNKLKHATCLAWMEDCLKAWKKAGLGWAIWNVDGAFGFMDSERTDIEYEDFEGHKLDRKMLDLLRKYAH